jgi:hypothetical protein
MYWGRMPTEVGVLVVLALYAASRWAVMLATNSTPAMSRGR